MSSLWTPSGEHQPDDEPRASGPSPTAPPSAPGGEPGEPDEAALLEEMRRVRAQLAATPAADIIANHAVGLWELAVLHLATEDEPPRLDEAGLAIDALAAIVEGLGDRLGPHAQPLRDALAQLRLAFVQIQGGVEGADQGGEES